MERHVINWVKISSLIWTIIIFVGGLFLTFKTTVGQKFLLEGVVWESGIWLGINVVLLIALALQFGDVFRKGMGEWEDVDEETYASERFIFISAILGAIFVYNTFFNTLFH